MDKAIAINVMATAIENLSMNIVEAAEFAGQVWTFWPDGTQMGVFFLYFN